MMPHLVEQFKIVSGIAPQLLDAWAVGDYVSLKNCQMAFVVAHMQQGNADQSTIVINQAQAVAGTNEKVLANVVPVWADLDVAASDALTRRTDAVNYQLDVGVKNKVVVFQIDPASLDVANGFDCINAYVATGNSANVLGVEYFLFNRYQEDIPPSAIVD